MRHLITAALLAAFVAGASDGGTPFTWSGTSGGQLVGWTEHRLIVERNGARRVLEQLEPSDVEACSELSFTSDALSLVGPIFSRYRESGGDCGGAHPVCSTSFGTFDLRTDKSADLVALFGKKKVLEALRRDPFVLQVAAESGEDVASLGLEGINALLRDKRALWLSTDAFYFHHLEGDRVAVRLGLTASMHANCGEKVELGLLLPVPAAWKTAFAQAASGAEGFLRTNRPEKARWGMKRVGTPPPEAP